MNIPRRIAAFGALALLAASLPAGEQVKTISLSLEDCLVRALKNNLSIQVAVLQPQTSNLAVRQSQEKFLPTVSFGFARRRSSNASFSWLESADITKSQFNNYSATLSEMIPLGGTVTVGLTSAMTDTNQTGTTINPRYNSQLQLSFSQPLLRNFGVDMTRKDILVARNNLDVSESQFAQTVEDTIYRIIEAYWNLVYSVENLKVQQTSLDLARDFLAKNQRSVEIGTLAPLDVLAAESEVATREAGILSAEASVKAAEDSMKNLLGFTDEEESGLERIVALDSPAFEERPIEVDEALRIAMDKRPDLRVSRVNVKTSDLNLRYARNQLLPSLSLSASYASPGVSGTRLLYDSDYFGNVIGTIPGYWSDSWNDVFGFKYENWNVALTLEFNLNTIVSRAAFGQAQVARQTAALNLKNAERTAVLEIRNAVRTLRTAYQQGQAYKAARELADKKLAAEEEKLRLGLSTNYTVLQYQRDMISARVAELKATIDYNIAQAGLDRAMGTLLEAKNIRLADILAGAAE